ncbi:hypothetical protein COEREDRAFT_11193 [Coemansia reversa NRRL 1564]|uniref:Uncharacterized protein n=1 Tax=Coemansia reversa (strain ATCC 12441 / NRRL 1564) TaxID=763665 RepID=A0A2G5B3K5_COERN|nr:hypothetical protein COEREDRAFT_11193 [Coemansia reversa NRRL 1564]|eukprot:PIA13599.1 hypothetical protein COEREDRAFT_11193 [Coemansia reversa NRRL 1564]
MVCTCANTCTSRGVWPIWFEPGDWVTIRRMLHSPNLADMFTCRRGPFCVVARHGLSYRLEYTDGIPFAATVPGDSLMQYHWDDDVDPDQIALSSTDDTDSSESSGSSDNAGEQVDVSSECAERHNSTLEPEYQGAPMHYIVVGSAGTTFGPPTPQFQSIPGSSSYLPPAFPETMHAGTDSCENSPSGSVETLDLRIGSTPPEENDEDTDNESENGSDTDDDGSDSGDSTDDDDDANAPVGSISEQQDAPEPDEPRSDGGAVAANANNNCTGPITAIVPMSHSLPETREVGVSTDEPVVPPTKIVRMLEVATMTEELEALAPEIAVSMSLPEYPTADPPHNPDADMELNDTAAEAMVLSPSPEQVVPSNDDITMDMHDPMAVDVNSESSESIEDMLEDIIKDEAEEKELALPFSITMPTSSEQPLPQRLPSSGSDEPSKFSAEPPASPTTGGVQYDLISYPDSSKTSITGSAPQPLSCSAARPV